MFSNEDEDGDFLSPTGGAKLASLFGLDQAVSQGNESFQYTAPKQPRKSSMNSGAPTQKPAPPPGSPAVLFATAVHAYRYVSGQYVKQGKLGAAVLGNQATKEYKLLLYASQQKPITQARIQTAFMFTVQPSNYCTFYDDQRQNWSVMFESEKAAVDFCKEVCIAKVNCSSSLDSVVTQDLLLGEGQGAEPGDSLEVAYTGWLLQNNAIGQVFDSNLNKDKLLRLKLGAGKVIKGWEEGMLGMRKGGKRLMVIPPSLAYGSQGVPNRVPADSTLVFEAEVRRVKFAKDGGGSERVSVGSRDSAGPSPVPSVDSLGPEPSSQPPNPAPVPSKPGDPSLRAKSNSLSEQLSNPDATKAKLISRMAKMGQPMLPFLAGPASSSSQAESSDSELEDPSVSRLKERLPAPSPQPVPITTTPPVSVQVTPGAALMPVSMATAAPQPMLPGAVHAFQPYTHTTSSLARSPFQPVGQMYPTQTVPYQGTGDVTSFLMTEARQHNTEIRLAVGKVADKVDQLASKLDDLHKQGGVSMGLSNVSMETAMIMHNIQRIIQENECLKKEVFEKSSRIEEQNRKIGELINQNQRYMEQSNLLMEQRNDSMKSSSEQNQARVLHLEQDKHALPQDLGPDQVRLTEELASATARVSELQLELSSQQQKSAALQSRLNTALQDSEQHSTQMGSLQTQLEELKETADRVQAQYRTEKQKRKELELKLSNTEEEVQDLKTEKDNVERTLADRKRKWQAERQRWDEELEEVRKAGLQEMDNLRSQLRKARTSTDNAAAEQLAQLQADLEKEWQVKCDQALATVREQQSREMTELTEQRDALQLKVTQLQDKLAALKQSRDSEEQKLLQQQDQAEELQSLQDKYSALEQRMASLREQSDARVAEMERRLAEQQEQTDSTAEVKRVMNGVFHSLRGEFDLNESYTGRAVIGMLVNTIKNVTLQLLTKSERPSSERSDRDEEEEEEAAAEDEEEEDEEKEAQVKQEKSPQQVLVNGKREKEEEEEEEERREAETDDKGQTEVGNVVKEIPEMEEKGGDAKEEQEDVEKSKQGVVTEEEEEEVKQETHHHDPVPETRTARSDSDDSAGTEKVTEAPPKDHREPQTPEHDEVPRQEETAEQTGSGGVPEPKAKTVSENVSESVVGPLGEPQMFGPPKNPPPPPNPLQDDHTNTATQPSSLTERVEKENGEPFFQNVPPSKAPPSPTEEEEEELSLKGRPPPAPLFGDDDDDDDLDWMG